MSTPQPPQAGGYGQAGPYGQQPPPPQHYAQPYPQQYPPHQPPPGPYGQGPYPPPGPGGWGGPPPPPPRKNAAATVWGGLGIAFAIVVGLVLFSMWGNRDSGGSSTSSDSFPPAEYKLTLPKSLLDGEYELASDLSHKGPQDDGSWDESYAKDFTPVVGQYAGADGAASGKALIVSGSYARINDHDRLRRSLMEGAAEGEGVTVAVPAEDVVTDGEILRCQVLTTDQAGTTTAMPTCAWADDNTGAVVGIVDPATATQDPESIDLKEAAATTLKIREEMREPLN
ncbi:hypothetical protein [Streptomyces luteolus]|uniref:Uncharacterized protein n=1 Tax=Streptomyces luteolus TaxID=3043615 RepID=A0ABT6SNG4_9ACTN|nr:hypothetical protein [Streptomyces sp. B-S-A12]MDI3417152.1 hypothetical protein [Streptomyces sp. B-S-A12]